MRTISVTSNARPAGVSARKTITHSFWRHPCSAPDSLVRAVDALDGLAQSIPQGVDLLRLVDDDTPIPRNDPFDDLVLLQDPPHVQPLGRTRLTVIGPSVEHLEALRDEWRRWLDGLRTAEGPEIRTSLVPGGDGAVDIEQARAAARAEGDRFVASLAAATEVIASSLPFGRSRARRGQAIMRNLSINMGNCNHRN